MPPGRWSWDVDRGVVNTGIAAANDPAVRWRAAMNLATQAVDLRICRAGWRNVVRLRVGPMNDLLAVCRLGIRESSSYLPRESRNMMKLNIGNKIARRLSRMLSVRRREYPQTIYTGNNGGEIQKDERIGYAEDLRSRKNVSITLTIGTIEESRINIGGGAPGGVLKQAAR